MNFTILAVSNEYGINWVGECCELDCSGCDTVVRSCISDHFTSVEGCMRSPSTPKFLSKQYEDTNSLKLPEGAKEKFKNPMVIRFHKWKVCPFILS